MADCDDLTFQKQTYNPWMICKTGTCSASSLYAGFELSCSLKLLRFGMGNWRWDLERFCRWVRVTFAARSCGCIELDADRDRWLRFGVGIVVLWLSCHDGIRGFLVFFSEIWIMWF